MQIILSALILTLAANSLAASSVYTFSDTRCNTYVGRTSRRSVPTSTRISTKRAMYTVKSTSTPTTTTTITGSTATITPTTTTVTVSTSTPVTTIPPSAGFTPLESQLAASGYVAMKKRDAAPEPDLEARQANRGRGWKGNARYPTSVGCQKDIIYVTVTTATIIGTKTSTVTVSRGPTTVTASTTSTLTSTSTVVAAAETFYAACAPDNMVSTIDGSTELLSNGAFEVLVAGPTTGDAYACCSSCLLTDDCGVSQFYTNADGAAYCNLFASPGSCDAARTAGGIVSFPNGGISSFSNSNCGRWNVEFPPA